MTEHCSRRVLGTIACLLLAAPLEGQAGIGLLDDASMVPRGLFRLRTTGVWTRYEQRFDASGTGTAPLGSPFITPALGTPTLPLLTITDSLIEDASGAPFAVSLGSSNLNIVAREEHIPLTFEYGLRRRFSLVVMMPIVRKRVAGRLSIDSTGATVGPNPQRVSSSVRANNALVQTQFGSAATQLQNALTACNASPASPGCPALLAREAEAQTLIQNSQSFALSVQSLYGSSTNDGEAFVPRSGGSAQAAIAGRVSAFNAQYKDILAQSSDLITAVPSAAQGPVGSANVIDYLHDLRGDSLANRVLLGVGDVEVGFRFLAVDVPGKPGGLSARVVVAPALRLPTGSRQDPLTVADLRIADGSAAGVVRLLADVAYRRLGLLAAFEGSRVLEPAADGVFQAGLQPIAGYRDVPEDWQRSLGIEPRVYLTPALSVHATYLRQSSEVTGAQTLRGAGVSFTTVSAYQAGTRPLPMEMRFSHLRAIHGDDGAPAITRDQLEVRIYYQRRAR